MLRDAPLISWPSKDGSRVPFEVFTRPDVFAREQEAIFRGPVWNFLGLDAEIPNPGDFRATYVGETPVIFNRDRSGTVKAFVNRCAHRGALVRREVSGNAEQHICIAAADEFVVAVTRVDGVFPAAAGDEVGAGVADDRIVAVSAKDVFDIGADVVLFAGLAEPGSCCRSSLSSVISDELFQPPGATRTNGTSTPAVK